MPPPTHNMLTRQLKRYLGSADAMPSEWRPLIEAVNDAYHEFDRDRGMLERSLELSSEELIEANASLRESEERYRTFLDSTADIAFVKDEEFRCVLINKAYQEYFRLPREAIVGKTDHDLMPKPMADNCRRTDQQAMAENNVVVSLEQVGDRIYETRKFPLRLKSGNVGVGGFIRDITERKRAEEALRQSEEKYRVLVETTNTGFLILDAQGKVIDANQDYVRLTGHDMLEEILGRNVVEWTAPYDLERNAREVKKCAAQGFVRNLEIDYVNRSGQVTPIEINATVVGSGGSARILSLCRDITERKRAEQALRESVERFRQIAESAGEWIWEEDAEGLYTYSSPVVEQILGYKPEELVGKKHFYDLFAPYVREEIKKAAFGRALRKEAFRKLANPVVCKDGRVIILETSGVPILDQEGRLLGYRGADTDITERK
ncbi:MAG: PAS domain S-box protein, partial [Verrucomicrobia bacterium]|nr:PAS domain S-box protein [Verrucomicrobiota bacterium]